MKLLVPKRDIIRPPARLFIPGLLPAPQILGAVREVNPGSQSWSTPGTYNFTLPAFNTLIATVKGAGGGGSSAGYADFAGNGFTGIVGSNGGQSQFGSNLIAGGGLGGPGGSTYNTASPMAAGASGTGYGGDQNFTGQGANGGVWGQAYHYEYLGWWFRSYGGNGGPGGKTIKTYTYGTGGMVLGAVIQIVVGAGGPPAYQYPVQYLGSIEQWPSAGLNGSVQISWS